MIRIVPIAAILCLASFEQSKARGVDDGPGCVTEESLSKSGS